METGQGKTSVSANGLATRPGVLYVCTPAGARLLTAQALLHRSGRNFQPHIPSLMPTRQCSILCQGCRTAVGDCMVAP